MIIFTAKSKLSGDIFVGNARDCAEEHWAQLVVKAEENGAGEILDMIREQGADQIEVETWGYAESPAESRELMKDACGELGARLIRTGRAPLVAAAVPSETKKETVALRQTGSKKEYQDITDVMVKIEMKRRENRKSSAGLPSTKKTIEKKSVVKPKTNRTKDKLPNGQTGSSSRDKRIREAIAEEKRERAAKKAIQVAAEADEMAVMLARLDAKSKEKIKSLRRK